MPKNPDINKVLVLGSADEDALSQCRELGKSLAGLLA